MKSNKFQAQSMEGEGGYRLQTRDSTEQQIGTYEPNIVRLFEL